MSADNPLTTARINRVVYDIRHWKLTLVVLVLVTLPALMFRFLAGRNMWGGGRSTDATFLHRATAERRGWWNDLPGAARAGFRIAAIAAVVLWFVAPVVVLAAATLELVVVGLSAYRRTRELLHERRILRPVWPAVAGIIGIPDNQPPARWLDIPREMLTAPTPDTEITVGLRAADPDDDRRVATLVQLFDQRYGRRHYGWVDYASRLVHIGLRPVEPPIWPAVANVLGVEDELAADWLMTYTPGAEEPNDRRIVVRLPDDVVNNVPIRDELSRLINQQFPGEWESRVERPTDRLPARVVLKPKPPKPEPPKFVDFLGTHPDYRAAAPEVN